MSILIKGMEMPKRCFECYLVCNGENGLWCPVANKDLRKEHGINLTRPDWCPLVELPPHGRLIDADALLSQYHGNIWTAKTDYAEGLRDVVADIKAAPTIIPAEKEGE